MENEAVCAAFDRPHAELVEGLQIRDHPHLHAGRAPHRGEPVGVDCGLREITLRTRVDGEDECAVRAPEDVCVRHFRVS